jgi:hypothetical protein
VRDRVIIPTYNRPELLSICLECLSKCPEIKDLDIYVYLDNHGSTVEYRKYRLWTSTVVSRFLNLNIKLICREPHGYSGNSYNVLMAYAEAYKDGCEHIFEIEDDILVTPDFFTWQYQEFNAKNPWFAVIGSKNLRNKNFYLTSYVTMGEDLCSCGVGYPRATIEKIIPHIKDEYFRDMSKYVIEKFPNFTGDATFSEQDGLLQRIMLDESEHFVYWAVPEKAYHIGWWGYHRNTNAPVGDLDERIKYVKTVLEDSSLLKSLAGRNDVSFNSDAFHFGEKQFS